MQDAIEALKGPSYSSPEVHAVDMKRLLEGNDVWMLGHVLLVLGFRAVMPSSGSRLAYPGEQLSACPSRGIVASAERYNEYLKSATSLNVQLERPENKTIRYRI